LVLQIASIVHASRNMALFDKTALTKTRIENVLGMASSFEDHVRGAKGYREAMQHYTSAERQQSRALTL
jgi:hypothetical protein